MDESNNELEEMIANDMAYNFTREIMINDEYNLKLIETIKRYGLSEKSAILMLMEMASDSGDDEI